MTYHELLERLKNDQLDKEQKKQVEADIEKHEAISDYLLEAADIPELEELSLTEPADDATLPKEAEQSEQFAKEIKAYITRAFAKAGIIVGACVLAIVLFVIFGLPKVTDLFYYNPAKVYTDSEGRETNQISLDMAVYSELFLPGNYRDEVACIPTGYGSYNIFLSNTITNNITSNRSTAGQVVRNKLTLYDPDILSDLSICFWGDISEIERYYTDSAFAKEMDENHYTSYLFSAEDKAKKIAEIKQLDDNTTYTAIVNLKHAMSYPDVCATITEPEGYDWFALCWKNEQGEFENNPLCPTGFISYSYGNHFTFENQKYPYLMADFDSYFESPNSYIIYLKQHVASMLRYVNDNPQFPLIANMHDEIADFEIPKDYYAQIAEQIEKHGLYVYGFVAHDVSKERMLSMAENEDVAYVDIVTD